MLHLIRGLPGSGKSTFAKSEYFGGMLHLENDQYWIDPNGQYKFDEKRYLNAPSFTYLMCETALQNHVNVVVSCVFVRKSSVQKYIDLAKKYNSAITIWRMAGNFGTSHNVPQGTLAEMKKNFEELDYPENIVETVSVPYRIVATTVPSSERKVINPQQTKEETKQ